MPAPTVPPMTSMVASNSPSLRASGWDDLGSGRLGELNSFLVRDGILSDDGEKRKQSDPAPLPSDPSQEENNAEADRVPDANCCAHVMACVVLWLQANAERVEWRRCCS